MALFEIAKYIRRNRNTDRLVVFKNHHMIDTAAEYQSFGPNY
ncbi:1221_t:CDS:1, partial [Dentiscutata heterogama]